MFANKTRVIVGLTTYYNENLMISLSGLSRLGRSATLVIHNDNPETPLSKRDVRRMGYNGDVYIINSEHNIGLLRSRLSIINFIKEHKINSDWFVFANDDDILLNLDMPTVGVNHFAIIQNMAVIRSRLIDVLRVMRNPDNYTVDDENVYVVRPHIGMIGTLVRTEYVLRLGAVLQSASAAISDIDESLGFLPPVDAMMWSALNIIARYDDENVAPIYMDTINYIATDIDNVAIKYGMPVQPSKNPQRQILSAIAKYDAAIRSVLMECVTASDAAPAGQESDAE